MIHNDHTCFALLQEGALFRVPMDPTGDRVYMKTGPESASHIGKPERGAVDPEMPVVMMDFDDMSHRYAPTEIMTRAGMRRVQRYVVHPPGAHDASPIRNEFTAVEFVTEFGSRWEGCARAYIAADLNMVLVGFRSADELTQRWRKVPKSMQQEGS